MTCFLLQIRVSFASTIFDIMVCSYIILIDAALTCHISCCFGHRGGSVEYCWCSVGSANWIHKVVFCSYPLYIMISLPPSLPHSVYHHSEYTTSLQMLYEMILQSAVLEDFAYWLFFGSASISSLSFSNWNIWKWMWPRGMEKILFRASMLFRSADRFVVKLISFPLFLLWDGVLFIEFPSFAHVCFKGLTHHHWYTKARFCILDYF